MLKIFIVLCVHTHLYTNTRPRAQIYAHTDRLIIGLFFGVGCVWSFLSPHFMLVFCPFSEILADKLLYLLVSVLAHSSR